MLLGRLPKGSSLKLLVPEGASLYKYAEASGWSSFLGRPNHVMAPLRDICETKVIMRVGIYAASFTPRDPTQGDFVMPPIYRPYLCKLPHPDGVGGRWINRGSFYTQALAKESYPGRENNVYVLQRVVPEWEHGWICRGASSDIALFANGNIHFEWVPEELTPTNETLLL